MTIKIDVLSLQITKDKEIQSNLKRKAIQSPTDVVAVLKDFIGYSDRENFIVMCLDTKNQITAIHTISTGTLNSSLVHPREVFKLAIIKNSASIILAHNHPSGNTRPSKQDIEITKRLIESGNILGIEILDHIIIGEYYTSLKEEGLI